MKIQNQCSNYSRRQQYVRGQARPVVGCGAMQQGWTRVPSPLPPVPASVLGLFQNRALRGGKIKTTPQPIPK